MFDVKKSIKKILDDGESKNFFFKKKDTIPHYCSLCGNGPLEVGDYIYMNGKYYHNDCFILSKKEKKERFGKYR